MSGQEDIIRENDYGCEGGSGAKDRYLFFLYAQIEYRRVMTERKNLFRKIGPE
jgi:hypothetical protein